MTTLLQRVDPSIPTPDYPWVVFAVNKVIGVAVLRELVKAGIRLNNIIICTPETTGDILKGVRGVYRVIYTYRTGNSFQEWVDALSWYIDPIYHDFEIDDTREIVPKVKEHFKDMLP